MNLGIETEQIEFKKSTSELKEAVCSIAAILNKHQSGRLYFGVNPKGDIVGLDVSEKTLRDVSQAISNKIEPKISPIIEKLTHGEKAYIRVQFDGIDTPYSAYGRYRIRQADEDMEMTTAQLERFFAERLNSREPWDRRVSSKTLSDIDEETLKAFIGRGNESMRVPFKYTNSKETLEKLGLLHGKHLLNAADVLFCNQNKTMLKTAIFPGESRANIIDMQQEEGTIFSAAAYAEQYIMKNIRWAFEFTGEMQREEVPEIPQVAIREAVINSFCHRDWMSSLCVQVDIFPDAIRIFNPGKFPSESTPESHLSGKTVRSTSRNEKIAETLFKSKDIESYGTGLPRIKSSCDEAGVKFEYRQDDQGTTIIFERKWELIRPIASYTNDLRHIEEEAKVMEFVKEKGEITTLEAIDLLKIKDYTARRILINLVEHGLLEKAGGRRNRAYKLPENKK